MRTIKFRGKSIATGSWSYGHYVEGSPNYHYITKPNGDVIQVNFETIGQFTGLIDKNGLEIYNGMKVLNGGIVKTVEWCQQFCQFHLTWKDVIGKKRYEPLVANFSDGETYINDNIEVTGNIHEK